MKQVTLVSLYGQKRRQFADLVALCTDVINSSRLRTVFRPYRLEQVHATLIGLEKVIGYSTLINANKWLVSSAKPDPMQFEPLFGLVDRHFSPMRFQFGGFTRSFAGFDSFGRSPYERAFQFQWTNNRVTLIGWPHDSRDFITRRLLQSFRDEVADQCNVRHKYRGDNDLFIVLGELVGLSDLTTREVVDLKRESARIEKIVRDRLATAWTDITVTAEDILVVQYEKETLPLESSVAYRIMDPVCNADLIAGLY